MPGKCLTENYVTEGLMREGVVARPANNVQPQSQNDVPRTTLEAAQHEVAQNGTARQSDIRQVRRTWRHPMLLLSHD